MGQDLLRILNDSVDELPVSEWDDFFSLGTALHNVQENQSQVELPYLQAKQSPDTHAKSHYDGNYVLQAHVFASFRKSITAPNCTAITLLYLVPHADQLHVV